MNISYKIIGVFILLAALVCGCKKSFLDAKPSTGIVAPTTLSELQGLLENSTLLNFCTPSLSLMASDDYVFVDFASWQATDTKTERNSYIWAKDLYGGENSIPDWNYGYKTIFYCNNVLDGLSKIKIKDDNIKQYNLIKGWALFLRAYALYDLVRNFSKSYDRSTSTTDLGLPIRLKAGIDELVPRSSLQQTYDRIFSDLDNAKKLLDNTSQDSNRPSKVAAYALFARIYLSMREYTLAENFADSTLSINKKLIDYNTVSKTATSPFTYNNDETLFSSTAIISRYLITLASSSNNQVTINPELIKLYDSNDLRLNIYYGKNSVTGSLYPKRRYYPQGQPFTGLATDEIYLVKAECLARRNQIPESLTWLNTLLKNRFRPIDFNKIVAENQDDALTKILEERRKELVWRTLRWSDLKRLNKEGANINLTRVLNGGTYTLPPNDPRYIFPIPDDEISLSKIQQNER